jgi:hypothetical protein
MVRQQRHAPTIPIPGLTDRNSRLMGGILNDIDTNA